VIETGRGSGVDLDALREEVAHVCRIMQTHAGAIELVGVSDGGVVELRFVGMCQGCVARPMTLYGTVIPALMGVPGVTEVRAQGVRISDAAARRAAERLSSSLPATHAFIDALRPR